MFHRDQSYDTSYFLYINDISSDLINNVRLFADDTSLYVIVDQDTVEAADSLTREKLDKWSKQWLDDFNLKKTLNLNFSRKNTPHPIIEYGNNGPDVLLSNIIYICIIKCVQIISP